jgi:hypothetical protein
MATQPAVLAEQLTVRGLQLAQFRFRQPDRGPLRLAHGALAENLIRAGQPDIDSFRSGDRDRHGRMTGCAAATAYLYRSKSHRCTSST